jgi:hypothetical protein
MPRKGRTARSENARIGQPPEPLLLTFLRGFVENLSVILRVLLVAGAILFIREIPRLQPHWQSPVAESEGEMAAPPPKVAAPIDEAERASNERVRHYMQCTYKSYRDVHFDACADDSRIYRRPATEPDETGYVPYEKAVLFAGVQY